MRQTYSYTKCGGGLFHGDEYHQSRIRKTDSPNKQRKADGTTRWAPTSYKLSYNPYMWSVKWVPGVITLLIGFTSPFITSRGPPCKTRIRNSYLPRG